MLSSEENQPEVTVRPVSRFSLRRVRVNFEILSEPQF